MRSDEVVSNADAWTPKQQQQQVHCDDTKLVGMRNKTSVPMSSILQSVPTKRDKSKKINDDKKRGDILQNMIMVFHWEVVWSSKFQSM